MGDWDQGPKTYLKNFPKTTCLVILEKDNPSKPRGEPMRTNKNKPAFCVGQEHSLNRRMFLQGMVAGGMAFGGFGQLFSAQNAVQANRQQKHVILVFMSGGPSQFETWDPKPGTPTGGPHLPIQTALPGIRFDEYMPNLARMANRMSVIRSMTSPFSQHVEGCLYTQTSHRPSPTVATPPHWLSICSRLLPGPNGRQGPSYVMLGEDQGAFPTPGPGWLGARYGALLCPGAGRPPQDLPAGTTDQINALQLREGLRSQISQNFRVGRAADAIDAHDTSFQRMGDLLRSQQMFDISAEPPHYLDRYGRTGLGRDCLLARRLIEHGVSFVRVQHQRGGAWDKHRRIFQSQRYITAEFDQAVSALVQDLMDRGLWDHTLLICMGEFGRTPEISGQPPGGGRNHWSRSWALSLGGCGLRGGVVVGSTNANGTEIHERPVTVPDLFCTFYRALGLNPHQELMFQDRPIPLVENSEGEPVEELL